MIISQYGLRELLGKPGGRPAHSIRMIATSERNVGFYRPVN